MASLAEIVRHSEKVREEKKEKRPEYNFRPIYSRPELERQKYIVLPIAYKSAKVD